MIDMYERLINAAMNVEDNSEPFITIRSGNVMFRVRNEPARLLQLAQRVLKCPGFTGRHVRPKFGVKPFRIGATSDPVVADTD